MTTNNTEALRAALWSLTERCEMTVRLAMRDCSSGQQSDADGAFIALRYAIEDALKPSATVERPAAIPLALIAQTAREYAEAADAARDRGNVTINDGMCFRSLAKAIDAHAALASQPQAAGAVECDNLSGTYCTDCRRAGFSHCSDPINCGGMKPMAHHRGCAHTQATTGNAEADRMIGRLMSADPSHDDCTAAAVLIRRLAATTREGKE